MILVSLVLVVVVVVVVVVEYLVTHCRNACMLILSTSIDNTVILSVANHPHV